MNQIENIYSLSPLQQGLLFHNVYEPQSRVYHQQSSLRIDGPLDLAASGAAWRTLIARHPVLRTAFLWEDLDDAYQVVLREVPLPLIELDWRGRPDLDSALHQLEIKQREAPFDLAIAPLMRLCVVRLGEQRWQLIWTHHHIVLDGWSVGRVLDEWLTTYRALSRGEPAVFPAVRPYEDYIAWLAEQDEDAVMAYWRAQLEDFSEPTPLPDFCAYRPGVEGLPYAEQRLVLSAEQTRSITDFARAQRITLSTLIQGAWALLLGHHARRDEVLFGVTLAGRPSDLAGADDMIGLFINTLPLRVQWADNPRIDEWLHRLQDAGSELRQVEHTPLARLKALSSIPADRALFDTIVVFENFPIDASLGEKAGDLLFSSSDDHTHADSERLTQGRNNYPLSLIVVPGDETLELILSYARARFSTQEIRSLLAQLRARLTTLAAHAHEPVQSVCWVSSEERTSLLGWGTGERVPVPSASLHGMFERHVDEHPEQEALVSPEGTLCYLELDKRANRLAHHLLALGVAPGQAVAVAMERSTDFVIAMLAVLKAGAAYLSLDMKQPPVRLAELLRDSGARQVVTLSRWQSVLENALARCEAKPVWLDTMATQLGAYPDSRPTLDFASASAAYLMYTSGSTGQPKAVVIEHHAIVDYVTGVLHALALPPQSRFALVSTVAADLGHTQLFGALAGGGTLCLVDDDAGFDPLVLADFLAEQRVDVLKITPSHLHGLLAAHPRAALLPHHTLIFGGETLDAALVERVRQLVPGLRVFNHYGPTETAVGAVLHPVPSLFPNAGAIPLGKPQPNRRLYVLDSQGQPVSVGVPGELYIGGAAIAREYLGRPELTREHFLTDPFAGGAARMYRTGDRVRWLERGELLFLGRVDSQVKIRGHRVELGEVEAHVKQLSAHIRQAVARMVQLPDQPPRLVAYVVADQSLSADKLRDDLAMRVPDYMVPSAFITLDTIPLNANGKPDFRHLPLPDAPGASRQDHVPPRNHVERLLAEIWQAVLRVESIGVHDNFFTLGGDSILSLQIIARANQQGLRLNPKQLFEHRTIAGLAAVLQPTALAVAAQTVEQLTEQPDDVPLTAGQLSRTAGSMAATWRCVALVGSVTPEILERALASLAQHHRALQVALARQPDATWHQILLATPHAIAVSREHVATDDFEALAALAEQCLARLDLASGEGMHACLLDRGATSAALLVVHPLLVDEESWPLLLRDLELALAQLTHGRTLSLAQTGGDLLDWARDQRVYARNDALDPAWEHWLQHAGIEVPALTVPDVLTAAPATSCTVQLDLEQTRRLERVRARLHVEWVALITTALAAELGEVLASDLLLIDVQAGRPDRSRLPLAAPIAQTDFDPGQIVGALSHPAPLFLRWRTHAAPLEQVRDVATQLASQPQLGGDYGVLRHLSDNSYLQEPLLALPRAQVGLAMLGDWDAHREPHGVLGEVLAASAPPTPGHALHVSAQVHRGQFCLTLQGPLATSWADRVQARLMALAALADVDGVAPAAHTFPACDALNVDLDTLPIDWADVEEIYPLSPMQQGMLLHTLLQPQSGIYLMQQRYRWDGPLDRRALQRAWQLLLRRHPMLRTGFWWHEDGDPVQCVYRQVEPAFAWYDWRGLEPEAQAQQLDAVLAAERHQGFDMRRAPLTYLRVFQMGEQRHILARSFHHILTDAWCFGILMQDLFALYQAEVHGQPAARPLARPFRDYIRWLARQDQGVAQRFWRAELAGFMEPTSLAVDRAPGSTESAPVEVDDVNVTLGVAQTRMLLQLCQEHELTPNTWLQGAWAILLARYSGQSDVLFGVTVAGRPTDLRGVEDMVGLFINSLPLRVTVDDQHVVIPWLQTLLAHNVEIRRHEYAPLADIQRWSEVERGRSLFESLVVFENAPLDVGNATRSLGFSIDIYEDRVHTNYPITVVAYPGDRLGIRISYDRQRFTRDAIERMLGHLVELMLDMAARPAAQLGALRMLTAAEQQALLQTWNQTHEAFPLQATYAELFARQADAHPERIAAVCAGETLRYGELAQRARRLAQALVAAGAPRDTVVVLLAERGLALLTMMIAVQEAGAAMLPLDVNHPPERLAELVTLSRPPVVLMSESARALWQQISAALPEPPPCLLAEALWQPGDDAEDDAFRPTPGRPEDLAYVIFTSGSTGTPKGVMVEQRGMLNNIYGKVPSLGLSAADRIAQTASPAFDISVWQFLAAPLLGGTVHILPDPVAHDPARLLAAVEEHAITLLEAVPAVLRSMLEVCPDQVTLPALRWVLPTGEALPPALCRLWFARFPHVPLMNAYGPAECSDDVAFHPITASPPADCVHMPIGRPTANNQLLVLDESLRPVPIGVPGELCVAGVGVGRGYLFDPERTRAAFVPHPFVPGARLYRTGDLGRWRPDGILEFLGRKDQQVKVRGHRIELGEIESRLERHTAVDTTAVLALPDARGDLRLVAYWQPVPGATADAAALAAHLGRTLPPYMVPAIFIALDALPLNPNGKLDRKALATRPLHYADALTPRLVPPRNDTEAQLAVLWAELLALPHVSVHDSFFALGGHSLLATQVISRIRARFHVELPLRALFEHPTLAQLAHAVDLARAQQQQLPQLPPITPQPRADKLPLSFAQQRLWFLEQLQGQRQLFTIPFALRLTGSLQPAALHQSFEALIARHEVLRTAFLADHGQPWQTILPPAPFPLPIVDLSVLDQHTRHPRLAHELDAFFALPFDLERPPLLRATLFRIDSSEHILAIALHHIVSDAWSISLLVGDLMTAYHLASQGEIPALPPAALQYVDYAIWQRQHLQGRVWQQQMNYWRQALAGSQPRMVLPGTQQGPATARRGARLRQRLPRSLVEALQQNAERNHATLFMVLYAGLNVLLYQQLGYQNGKPLGQSADHADFLIGTDVANRHHHDTEDMVGFFVNQLVLRCRLHGDQRFTELLAECRRMTLDAYQYQDLPFDALVAELLPQRDARHASFFQLKLVLQNTPQRDLALANLSVAELELEPREVELDLLINAVMSDDGLLVVYDYRADLYPPAYIEQLAALFELVLQTVAAAETHTLTELAEMLSQREHALRQQSLDNARASRDEQRAALAGIRRKPVADAATRG